MNPGKIKVKYTQEMLFDLKHHYGMDINEELEVEKEKNELKNMLHYEYIANDKREIELIKEQAEIDYEDGKHFIYSLSKKQLRKIKLGSIEGIKEFSRMKKIIFHSEFVQDISRILEMKLSKELGKEIDKKILENIRKLGGK